MRLGRVGAVGMIGDMTPVVTGLIGMGGDDNSRSAWSSDGACLDSWRGARNSDDNWRGAWSNR